MVIVTREEADVIRQKAPQAHIAIASRTKGSSRKRYYAEESRDVKMILREMRPEMRQNKRPAK